ncbi:ferredoxin reductase [Kocuria rosea]|uniref:ferredoxin reductase n=1 Tax=Kocuria rosea TaxID=1275 RepID=UPI00203BA70A|nr:ferredoxin reductase [Kocuria rosea]MCM3686888.1 ferredoxin reductase [Kocuria rosea]HST72056.1 ferredoxin reductase [Kocuria rosea]
MAPIRLISRLASAFTTPFSPEDFLRLVDPLASARQLRALVTAVEPETADSVTIRFRPGKGWNPHEAGQWARIGVEIDGVRHWRSYSLSTGAGQDPAITVKAMGTVSGALVRGTRVGDVLFLAPPEGDFVLPAHPRPLLMLTAGSGLTPVMSMIRTLVPRRADADVVLVHSSRAPQDALFAEELLELADQFPGFRLVHWFTAERGRRLDLTSTSDLDAACPDWRDRAAYACGPADFLDAAESLWDREEGQLRVERFAPVVAPGPAGEGGQVTFEKSDKDVDADGATTLLEAGEAAGVLLPSGCRMGICHSCVKPLVSGRVRDTRTGEVHGEPGHLVQTCVSTAAGPVSLDA